MSTHPNVPMNNKRNWSGGFQPPLFLFPGHRTANKGGWNPPLLVRALVLSLCAFAALSIFSAEPAADASANAVATLKSVLENKSAWGDALATQAFAQVPLTQSDAEITRSLLWQHHAARINSERAAEIQSGSLKLLERQMPFTLATFGTKPKDGWSLWISMHGGGGAPKALNDQQWENQKRLYKLTEGLYLVPRAPTNTWNLWHEAHIDAMFARLIEDLIVLKDVNPDRVYIMGYSAGGDGVYQLAPRMADHWAAAAMMAGHPNDASPLGLRNLGFAIQAGALDTAYNRNKIAREWIEKLDQLQRDDPKGYVHFGKIHENKAHWMDGEDAKVLPWMAALSRNPVPDRVVWKQSTTTHERFYWLALPPNSKPVPGSEITVEHAGQTFDIKSAEKIQAMTLRLDERLCKLSEPVRVSYKNQILFDAKVPRTIAAQMRSLESRGDPKLMFDAEIEITIPEGK